MHDPLKNTKVLSAAESKAHLVEELTGLVDRTFTEGGHGVGMRALHEMLLRLDEPALRQLVQRYGIEGAEEMTEPQPEPPRA
jgi:hypothetical protein